MVLLEQGAISLGAIVPTFDIRVIVV